MNREFILTSSLVLIMSLLSASHAMAAFSNHTPDVVRCKVKPGTPNDGPPAIRALIIYVESTFYSAPAKLQQAVRQWKKPGCLLDDGRPKMSVLLPGIKDSVNGNWDYTLGQVQQLEKRYPKSDILALAEAEYWRKYAWHARGAGVASTVTPEGLKLFKQRLQRAEQVLNDTKAYASDLPGWYELMIEIEFELDRPQKTILNTFREAVQRYKYYYPDYFTMLFYLLPKWYGSWQAVDNFANWSVKYTKPQLGDTMYVRTYWYVYEKMWKSRSFFSKTKVSWKKMKASFQTVVKRYPKSYWDLNNYAKFACLAGDGETFLSLRKKMGGHVMKLAWDRLPIELCEERFAGQDRQYGRN